MDLGIFETVSQTFGNEEIVNTPACVPLSRTKTVRPPGVGYLLWIECAEGVNQAIAQQLGHLLTLFIGKASVLAVRLWILEVYFLMGNIHVTAYYNRLFLIEFVEIGLEVILPLHTIIQSTKPVL